MSHITEIQVEIKDLIALEEACKRLGGELVRGQKTYRWYGMWVGDTRMPAGVTQEDLGKCDHAIRFPTAYYEVGVVRKGSGYALRYDFYRLGGLLPVVGENAEKLVQAYAVEAAISEAERLGYTYDEETLKDGSIQLEVHVGESR